MKKIILFLVAIILLTTNGYTQKNSKKQKTQPAVQSTETALSFAEYQANKSIFIDAVKERLIGNYTQAEELFQKCISINPSYDVAHYEYAKVLIHKYKYTAAIDELKTAIKLNETNIWYKILLAETYDNTNQFALSEKMWSEISKSDPQNVEYVYKYTVSLIYQNKLKEALNGYNMIEVLLGVNEDITNAKKSIWLHLDKVDNAAKEMEKLAEAFPSEARYYLEIADMYIVNKMTEKAVPYLKKAEKIDPNNPKINITLYNYYTENKKYDEAFGYLKKAFASTDLDIDEKVKILIDYYSYPKDSAKAYQLLDNLIKTHPDDPKTWSIYADFLTRDDRFTEAKVAFEKVISRDESRYLVWQQYLAVLLDLELWDDVYKQSHTAMSLFPTQAFPYLAYGMAASVKKEYENAASVLEEGKKYAVDDPVMLQINLLLAEAYSQLKDFAKSDKYYEDLIRKYPNNATLLNNYSYGLSEREHRIDYALQLAKKAVELSPNTAIFEDTYAWAFFKNKDYKNAKLWLEKALANGGGSEYEILLHYSEVLEVLGEMIQAREYKDKANRIKKDE